MPSVLQVVIEERISIEQLAAVSASNPSQSSSIPLSGISTAAGLILLLLSSQSSDESKPSPSLSMTILEQEVGTFEISTSKLQLASAVNEATILTLEPSAEKVTFVNV